MSKPEPQTELKSPPVLSKSAGPVSLWYIISLTTFSLGTSAVSWCSGQALQITTSAFTASTFIIGLVTSLQALNQLWVTPYAAWKSDRIWTRIGRRKPLVLVMAPLLAVTVILVPHCPSLWMLFALVFVLQMAEDAELAIMTPSISDSVPDRQRPLATGMWRLMLALSGFLMGRYAMPLMDTAEHWPYTIAGVTVLLTGGIFLVVMRERYVPPRTSERFRLAAYGRDIFRLREHRLIYVVFLFQPLFVLVGSHYFPMLATKTLHMTKSQYGPAFAWGAFTTLLVSVPLGVLFNKWRRRRALTIAACALAVVPTTFGLFFVDSAVDMAVFFAMREFVFIVFLLNFMPYVMEYTTPGTVATVLGFTTALNGVVRFTMVPLFGLLIDAFGHDYRLPLWGGYVGIVVCIIALAAMRPPDKVRHLIENEVRS